MANILLSNSEIERMKIEEKHELENKSPRLVLVTVLTS